jgi:hypothetical protein
MMSLFSSWISLDPSRLTVSQKLPPRGEAGQEIPHLQANLSRNRRQLTAIREESFWTKAVISLELCYTAFVRSRGAMSDDIETHDVSSDGRRCGDDGDGGACGLFRQPGRAAARCN